MKRSFSRAAPRYTFDPGAITKPVSIKVQTRRGYVRGCVFVLLTAVATLLLILICLLAPLRTNLLFLGIDRAPEGSDLSRSDTIILLTVVPLQPYVGMLSIPRDLWVTIPGVGENRINTAHFYAEGESPGRGPFGTLDAIETNFGVQAGYYVRIRFDGIQQLVDALGGVDIVLDRPTALFPAGSTHLDGEQSLAFVRDRQGADDFSRMQNGQIFLKALWRKFASLDSLGQLPAILNVLNNAIDTNIPVWVLPRLCFALIRSGPDGIDARVISREMVNPFTTSGGAQVLGPNWEKINPLVVEMFGR